MSGRELIAAIRRASFVIEEVGGGHWGSAIAISPHHIATAKHVITNCKHGFKVINSYDSAKYRHGKVHFGAKDIAIIEIEDTIPNYIAPCPKPWSGFNPGDVVYSWASASAIEQIRPIAVSAGFLVTQSVIDRDADFAFSMGIWPGCSGAGIVHQSGCVIGVVSATYSLDQNIPWTDRSISYGVDLYPLAKELKLVKGDTKIQLAHEWHWYTRELAAMAMGAVVATTIRAVVRNG